MKVLHTNFLRGWGGQSNRILTESLGVARRGWDVVISAPGDSQLIARAEAQGLAVDKSVKYVGGLRWGLINDVRAMKAILLRYQPDIIHLHGGRDSWAFAKAMLLLPAEKRPIVLRTKHNIFPVADHVLNRWQYGKCFDGIVCISSAIVEQLAAKPYINRDKLVTIPSAIDADRFNVAPGTRKKVRTELGYTDDEVVIGITGRLRPEKAHDVLFRAVPLVVQACPQARFVCFGSGSLGGELKDMLSASGVEQYVKMAGFRKDVPQCLSALDVYTQPSRSEGLGTSVLEACAAGLPVAASNSGGIPDIIEDGINGLLVPVEDHTALARALIQLVRNPQQGAAMGSAGREKIRRDFSVERLTDSTDTYYRQMLASRSGAQLP